MVLFETANMQNNKLLYSGSRRQMKEKLYELLLIYCFVNAESS